MFKQITSKFVYIDEIDPLFQRYEIRVRIIRLWRGFKKDTGSAIEMVLVDEKVLFAFIYILSFKLLYIL